MSKFYAWLKNHFAVSFCHPERHFLVGVFGRFCFALGTIILDEHTSASSVCAILDKENS